MTHAARRVRAERILIVGGGIAGLSLAIVLRRHGLSPEIVEHAEDWRVSGAGLYLVGAATRALARLGLREATIAAGAVTHVQTFRDHRGRRLADVDVDAYWRQCGPCVGISRTALHHLLAAHVDASRVRFGLSVASLREAESEVMVEFTDGSRASYDLVVGADGIRSGVRQLVIGGSRPRFRGQIGWRFTVRPSVPTHTDGWTVYLGAGSAFLLVPIGDGAVYGYADRLVRTPEAGHAAEDVTLLREHFRHFAPLVQEIVALAVETGHIYRSPIEEAAREAWGRGRVVLIGDAAHAMSPNMACGVAMALEDAIVLASLIAQPGRAVDVLPELLHRRSARVRWVWRQTHQRDRLRGLPSVIRNFVLRRGANRTYRANYAPLLAPA